MIILIIAALVVFLALVAGAWREAYKDHPTLNRWGMPK
jgi:uncharacterized membrane protein YozB (DUF420 family)